MGRPSKVGLGTNGTGTCITSPLLNSKGNPPPPPSLLEKNSPIGIGLIKDHCYLINSYVHSYKL